MNYRPNHFALKWLTKWIGKHEIDMQNSTDLRNIDVRWSLANRTASNNPLKSFPQRISDDHFAQFTCQNMKNFSIITIFCRLIGRPIGPHFHLISVAYCPQYIYPFCSGSTRSNAERSTFTHSCKSSKHSFTRKPE